MDEKSKTPIGMSRDRSIIFKNIANALAGVKKADRPEIDFAGLVARRRLADDDPWASFRENFESVRGVYCDSIVQLVAFIQKHKLTRGYCDPELKACLGEPLSAHFAIDYQYTRELADTLSFSLTLGSSVIAETGTVILKDRDTVNRLAAVAPWLHVAVVEEKNIHRTLHDALLALDDDPNIIFVTGPSKTGDIEGILIEGVHGPGEQVCYRLTT